MHINREKCFKKHRYKFLKKYLMYDIVFSSFFYYFCRAHESYYHNRIKGIFTKYFFQEKTAMEIKNTVHTNADVNGADLWVQILKTPESRFLAAGLFAAFAGITVLGLSWIWKPEQFQILIAMTVTNVIFGRAAGLSIGYSMNLGHSIVLQIAMITETILVLLFYPIFVLSWNRLLVIPALKKIIAKTSKAAEEHQEKIRKYGMVGLFIFVWSPFWMTGPMVGCAIGYLIGLNPFFNMAVVLSGTYLATTCWAFFLNQLQHHIAKASPYAPYIFIGIIAVFIIGSRIAYGLSEKMKRKRLNN